MKAVSRVLRGRPLCVTKRGDDGVLVRRRAVGRRARSAATGAAAFGVESGEGGDGGDAGSPRTRAESAQAVKPSRRRSEIGQGVDRGAADGVGKCRRELSAASIQRPGASRASAGPAASRRRRRRRGRDSSSEMRRGADATGARSPSGRAFRCAGGAFDQRRRAMRAAGGGA